MINTAYLLGILLIFLRMSTFFMIIPSFFPKGVPNTFKVFFTVLVSYILIFTVDYSGVNNISNNYMLIMYCFNEIMTGLVMGFVTSLIFHMVNLAGSLMDIHIGLGMLSMYDPTSQSTNTLLARLLHWMAIILFFVTDTHHLVIKELVKSYTVVKMGQTMIFQQSIMMVFNAFVQYFIIGIKIALPIVFIILMTDVVLGLISRTVPQIQVMILGMPIKILVGIVSFLISLPIMVKLIVSAFNYFPDLYKGIFGAVPMFFIFAGDDKTEQATPKKQGDARKKGQVARSKDVNLAITLLTCTFVIASLGNYIVTNLKNAFVYFFSMGYKFEFNPVFAGEMIKTSLLQVAKAFLPIAFAIMVAGVVSSLIQTGFMFIKEPLKPTFSKLNPINGFKNMFSTRSLVDLGKNLIVVSVVGFIGYGFIRDNFRTILQFGNTYMPTIGLQLKSLIVDIFRKITIVMVIIAIADFTYQKFKFKKEMKMTKQEVKEEAKQAEGDPQVKGKIKQKQREMARSRMMQAVPDATVVITNPTHYAVALKYIEGEMQAPKLVAKGADLIALNIKEKAKENDIPIIENKPLARLIYDRVELEEDIPQDLYQAIAEILAIVYKMQKK
ncbi:fused FliR family export protein/FlhB family type III secretion system protein [Inconstantimicrobium mannanitabidum]|uniref:Flagellar biosynthetic protein FliR n=1 Tax=Inconstantimicrobium mannanitabidum TaxID=1604901 RepID=A0ACB5R8N8_9CLOT|nr:fused FliR family export protein/FlhB family type III secretion system protein [Clostridium sp. TW13]GKX65502.1 flagellar biosynthetic protein FliR [Clostridium sp. TW13]